MPRTERHLILCGGLAGKETGFKVLRLQTGKERDKGQIYLDVESLTKKLVESIPPALYDLLKIATYVYVADQCVSRGGPKRFDYGEDWHRQFRFVVPVKGHDVWSDSAMRAALEETLGFVSGDTYEFQFEPQGSRNDPDWLNFTGDADPGQDFNSVMLFSGGLDSFTGATEEILRHGVNPVLVGHYSCNPMKGLQRGLFEYLVGLRHNGMKPLHVPIGINKDKELTRDTCQRTRSFLYGTLGAVVARRFGLDHVRFYENGIVSCNLPFDGQTYQAKNTRSTHPKFLRLFSELVGTIIDAEFHFENPYFEMTRTDVCLRLKELRHEAEIEHTRSCAKAMYVNPATHCALCSQCIDRRFATLAGECAQYDPDRLYARCIFTEGIESAVDRAMVAGFAGFATQMESMTAEGFAAEFSSDLMEIGKYMPGSSFEEKAKSLYELHRRQASQVNGVLAGKMAIEFPRLRRGALPDSCLLHMIGRKEHLDPNKILVEGRLGQDQEGIKAEGNTGGRRTRGRKRKYSDEKLRLMIRTVEDLQANGMDSKGAWNNAADTHGFPSGDAARTASNRYLKNKSERN